jgi:hypothetical protein
MATPANHMATPANHMATPANHMATPANHLATPANYLATPTKRLVKRPKLRVLTENGYFYPFLCMNGLSIQYRMEIRVGVIWREA